MSVLYLPHETKDPCTPARAWFAYEKPCGAIKGKGTSHCWISSYFHCWFLFYFFCIFNKQALFFVAHFGKHKRFSCSYSSGFFSTSEHNRGPGHGSAISRSTNEVRTLTTLKSFSCITYPHRAAPCYRRHCKRLNCLEVVVLAGWDDGQKLYRNKHYKVTTNARTTRDIKQPSDWAHTRTAVSLWGRRAESRGIRAGPEKVALATKLAALMYAN